jgi:hypothetical protein
LVITAKRRLLRRRKAGCHTTLSSFPPHVIILKVKTGVSQQQVGNPTQTIAGHALEIYKAPNEKQAIIMDWE